MSMVRRRSTVRFRNGALVDSLIRKDWNVPWVPVGTNGCHQGAESLATASSGRRYPQGIRGYPEPTVRSRILCRPADQDAGRARVGTGHRRLSDRGTAWMAQVTDLRKSSRHSNGMVRG